MIDFLEQTKQRRADDAKAFEESDGDLCMMCHAYGDDKRTLLIRCLYDVHEVVPEALDTHEIRHFSDGGYYIRICKSCRGRFLRMLGKWRSDCVALRHIPKDHDGDIYDDNEGLVPVRKHGVIVWQLPEEILASESEEEK